MVYQIGSAISGDVHPLGLAVAIVILAGYIYMLVRKNPHTQHSASVSKAA
jgi:ferrous iron transport protein B